MTAPTLAGAPSAEDLADVTDPIDLARRITTVARNCGTLPSPLADLRRLALLQARAQRIRVDDIAAQVGISPGRVSQLTKTERNPR